MNQGHIVTPHFFKILFDTVPHIGLSHKWVFLASYLTKILYFPIHVMSSCHLILLDINSLIISGKEHISQHSPLCIILHAAVILSLSYI